jgi:endonuclease III
MAIMHCVDDYQSDRADWVAEINRRLLEHYGIPEWRTHNPAVDELVLTILSQNTSDLNSDRAFAALRARYRSWDEVLAAPEAELVEAIRAGGLAQQKAPRIQMALGRMVEECGSFSLDFLAGLSTPAAMEWLTELPGIGRKTASIVLLFCFDKPVFPVDTHITRISRRLGLVEPKANPDQIADVWEELAPPAWYYSLHLNLLKHGRQVCKAPTPRCAACVVRELCGYPHKTNLG